MHKNSQMLIASVAEPSRWLGLFWKHQIGTFQYIYDLLHKLPRAHTQSLSFCFVIWSCYLQDGFLTAQHNLPDVSRMDMKFICGAFIRFFNSYQISSVEETTLELQLVKMLIK